MSLGPPGVWTALWVVGLTMHPVDDEQYPELPGSPHCAFATVAPDVSKANVRKTVDMSVKRFLIFSPIFCPADA